MGSFSSGGQAVPVPGLLEKVHPAVQPRKLRRRPPLRHLDDVDAQVLGEPPPAAAIDDLEGVTPLIVVAEQPLPHDPHRHHRAQGPVVLPPPELAAEELRPGVEHPPRQLGPHQHLQLDVEGVPAGVPRLDVHHRQLVADVLLRQVWVQQLHVLDHRVGGQNAVEQVDQQRLVGLVRQQGLGYAVHPWIDSSSLVHRRSAAPSAAPRGQ